MLNIYIIITGQIDVYQNGERDRYLSGNWIDSIVRLEMIKDQYKNYFLSTEHLSPIVLPVTEQQWKEFIKSVQDKDLSDRVNRLINELENYSFKDARHSVAVMSLVNCLKPRKSFYQIG